MEPVFIVGSPRSGTTWLQILLAQFGEVATGQETRLFSHYLGPLLSRWEESRSDETGLHTVVDEEAFVASSRQFAVRVLEAILRSKPGATIAVEKTPGHVFHVRQIERLLPRARFVHIVRDPRAVTSSLMRVAEDWGAGWAPSRARDAARTWRRHVAAGRRAGEEIGDAYREVRYESLCRDPVPSLEDLCAWMGVEVGQGDCARAVEACSFDRINTEGVERAGASDIRVRPGRSAHSRMSRVRAWRDELSHGEIAAVEREVADLMDDLGYEPVSERNRLRRVLRNLAESTADALAALTRSVGSRIDGR